MPVKLCYSANMKLIAGSTAYHVPRRHQPGVACCSKLRRGLPMLQTTKGHFFAWARAGLVCEFCLRHYHGTLKTKRRRSRA